uniref:Glutamyl-tRNA(Gln) amidotransferase subunit C, chloroplastic/mitochondrial n=1 Tax=Lotus japonicus TaxID=34305 RepID=I3S188_LOTJA|nr:unknown [Lotus japonicus]
MGSSKGLILLSSKGASSLSHSFAKVSSVGLHSKFRSFSSTTICSSTQPPDLTSLAKKAQISLTPHQVDEFAPKIQQVIEWFGQLQSVDLQSVEPSLRAESENYLRENAPETFDSRDAMIASVPSYEEPYIKVPRVLSMD